MQQFIFSVLRQAIRTAPLEDEELAINLGPGIDPVTTGKITDQKQAAKVKLFLIQALSNLPERVTVRENVLSFEGIQIVFDSEADALETKSCAETLRKRMKG